MSATIRRFVCLAFVASLVLPAAAWAQDNSPVDPNKYTEPVKVACVGDSITAGVGAGKGKSWPDQLRAMLGQKWNVKNFGVSATTLMNSGDRPYQKTGAFKNAKDFGPDVVVIMLGTNDTKPQNWKNFEKDFEPHYKDMVKQFQDLPSKPRVFVCTPPYVAKNGNWGINEPNAQKEIPVVTKVAKEMKLGLIDVHEATNGKDEVFPDKVHPNADGAKIIASTVQKSLTGKEAPAEAGK